MPRQFTPIRKPPQAAQSDATDATGGMRQSLVSRGRAEEQQATGARFNSAFTPTDEMQAHYQGLAEAHQRLAEFLLRQAQALGAPDAAPRSNVDVIRSMGAI